MASFLSLAFFIVFLGKLRENSFFKERREKIMIIKKQLLGHAAAIRVGRGLGNPKKMIAVHDTGNSSHGANAQAHANLQSRQVLDYGWHWQVDDKEAIQSFRDDYRIYF